MKSEQQYYENPDLWSPEKYSRLQIARAEMTKQWLPETVNSVLDVGCGNGVITNMLDQIAVGVDRSWATLGYVRAPRGQADAANLPFASEAFDAVISTEVIEHLPYLIYKQVLAEMVRVSRQYILISVPYQEDLLYSHITCPVCGCRFHSYFHMRSFDRPTMETLFADFPQIQLVRAMGIMENPVYRFRGLGKRVLNLMKKNAKNDGSFANKLCPSCGYFEEKQIATSPSAKSISSIKKVFDPFWPRERSYHWWLALYSKV